MTSKRLIYICLFLVCQFSLMAQNLNPNLNTPGMNNMYDPNDPMNPNRDLLEGDTTQVEIISLAPKLYQWHISSELGNIIPTPADTAFLQFQNTNLTEGINGHYNYLGNLGAPRLSRIFSDRKLHSSSLFLEPFDDFVKGVDQHYFTNSNIPYTNITYYKTFDKLYGEDRFIPYFSVNVNKQLAFGFQFDYLYGRGYYQNQSTSYLKGGLFGSYVGDKYRAHFIYNAYNMKLKENGGITDDRFITTPDEPPTGDNRKVDPRDMPTVLSETYNYNKHFHVYLTHRYNLGFYRELADTTSTDSIIREFVPVTSFIHTAKVERSRHRFISQDKVENYFSNDYLPNMDYAKDSTTYFGVKNTFGIALLEGFNKYAKAGLTAYISHKLNKYQLMSEDSLSEQKYTEHEIYLGGELLKRQGNLLHYRVIGEVGIGGEALGQFKVDGDADLNVRLFNDTITMIARGSISNTLPAFYMRHYHSKHYWWDNTNMDKEFRTHLEGELNIARWRTNLRAGLEVIKNYTYFDGNALPRQASGNIKVATARIKQDFKLGILHLDNEVIWQKTSNPDVAPVPDFSLYHNLYINAKLAKRVLSLQLGVDVRYFTEYEAPAYSPGIQQFHVQGGSEKIKLGGYPIINAYANFHLKRTRFFVMMYHVNQGMSDPNYFLAPHYPINQRLLKVGLSWNFYD